MSEHTSNLKKKDLSSGRTKDLITFLAIITVLSFFWELTTVLGSMDEIWNYNLSKGVAAGHIPYRDFNMVMPPLFYFVFAVPLLFSRTLIIFRLTSAFMWVLTYTCFYKLCTRYIDHHAALLICVMSVLFSTQYTYNSLDFLFAVLVMLTVTGKKTPLNFALAGVFGVLAALSRQTSGSFLLIAALFIVIKTSKSNRLKNTVYFLAGAGITGVIFLVYLLATGSFFQFWDYCLFALVSSGGIGTLFETFAVPALLITVSGAAIDIYSYQKSRQQDRLWHLLIGLTVASISIPLVDGMHVIYMGMWFSIPLVEFVSKLTDKKKVTFASSILTAVIAITIIGTGLPRFKGAVFCDDFRDFRFIPMPEHIAYGYAVVAAQNREFEEQGYNVSTILHEASIISIMNDEFNPPFDLFLKGNQGTTDPMSYVEAVCSDDNAIILTSEALGWQMPDGIYEYVNDHCDPVCTFAHFTWYRPKTV